MGETERDPLGRCLYQEDEVLLAIRLGFAYALEEYGIWKDGERTIGCMNNNIKDVLKNFDDEKLAEKILLRVEQADELTRLREFRRDAIALLRRAYDSGHRHGWEPGESTSEVMNALHAFLENETDD